ncbi:MAG: sigma-70 family RNA polymerase sigma factor [Lachnospiraceae bacterium]|nr:sigma-70 family RNA polymerase sigma factor [Lachnospiraceae bacterium]MBR4210333.1 sigma-70 family RNA polymerase sigma factor [Lachnospiraceae bacterium]
MQSMDEIYQQYAQTVYGFLLAQTREENLAEELTQETFYQAIRTSDRFDESCKVSTWLCAIAKNVLFTYRRKHPVTEEMDETLPAGASTENEALGNLGRMEVLRLLHGLPEPGREVMYLRVFGGLSFAEIGEVHGKSENWARVTFYRAKEKLRKDVEK